MSESFVSLLQNTLMEIEKEKASAPDNHSAGWEHIISLYKDAIYKAKNNRCFSVHNACRIFVEFRSDFNSPIFEVLGRTVDKTEEYFVSTLYVALEKEYGHLF